MREIEDKLLLRLRERLEAARGDRDFWLGDLSPSALATATAVSALTLAARTRRGGDLRERAARGVAWLVDTQNTDGGWGDTPVSRSNISTTGLVLAALTITDGPEPARAGCGAYLERAGGIAAIVKRYGQDKTFSAPILVNMAIAGLTDWASCPQLPFWLAACPRRLFPHIGLRVVSYALPALLAVGLVRFVRTAAADDLTRSWRALAVGPVLKRLEAITPRSGGYLEATPITSFVAMSLIAAGHAGHPVVARNLAFLCDLQNPDGSWKIERDLAVWLTTLSVNALGRGGAGTRDWLLSQQTDVEHPYVGSAPGAWGWTYTDGSVPDVDDTAGALLALSILPDSARSISAARRGVRWLLALQNRDGGWPTFCRGWRHLPFDQSCADLTAHAIRALHAWRPELAEWTRRRADKATARGFEFLRATQRADGSWVPLWFGNEHAPDDHNPVYGTARVLAVYRDVAGAEGTPARRGVEFLRAAQNADGSWGGAPDVPGSLEETALACDALSGLAAEGAPSAEAEALRRGAAWLRARLAAGDTLDAAPIGLYFAKLWYFERLYPLIFSVSALRRVKGE